MLSHYYRLEYGSFYLYENQDGHETMVLMTDQIAMAYDPDTFTMLKHGSPDKVEEWAERASNYGLSFNIITFLRGFPIEEINKVLSTSGYLRYVINESADKHTVFGRHGDPP